MKKMLIVLAGMFISITISAQSPEIFSKDKTAINGYDPVAYFTESKAVKGQANYTVNWKEVNWLFSSQQHADLFKANPEKYAPQYGGYCAFGCSRGYKAKTEPDAWTIVDGKLYLNYNISVRESWNKDRENYIKKADNNWPAVKDSRYP
ncbi:MAG TPA: YHS domain-containing (seleno)protein [Chitinophagaceae bacterium]|nr:YHS domain-containing (seleno)protein [Chitinophagaceae bacterium]